VGEFELDPPHAVKVSRIRIAKTSHTHRFVPVRLFPPSRTNPASGMSVGKICNADHVVLDVARDAAPAGTLTVSENGTAVLLGVIVAGENVHVAPTGSVLCTQDSVIGCRGLPVFGFNESE
jgi:hypothetical protein